MEFLNYHILEVNISLEEKSCTLRPEFEIKFYNPGEVMTIGLNTRSYNIYIYIYNTLP